MIPRRQSHGPKRAGFPLGTSIFLWVLVLALTASGAWVFFGQTDLFTWSDQADRVQYSFVLAGGIGAVAALVVSYRKQRLAEASAVLDLESHFGGRFLAATEQLGSGTPTVRMAGALSLARLADDWVTQRQMVIDVVTAYLRMSANELEGPELEIRASLFRTIRDHLRPAASPHWQGLNFDFTSADMTGADFTEIETRAGTTLNFTEAVFSRGFVRLSGNFTGETMAFTRAQFCGAIVEISGSIDAELLDFDGTDLSGGALRMDGLTFTGNRISFLGMSIRKGFLSFSGSTFETQNIDFAGIVILDEGSLLFDHCDVQSGDLSFISARLAGSNTYFAGTKFSGTTLFFNGTQFSADRVSFHDVDFGGAVVNFSGATFYGPSVDFHKAKIHPESLELAAAACIEGVVDWGQLETMRDAFAVFPDKGKLHAEQNEDREMVMKQVLAEFAKQRQEE
ncbi:pentapeptide repeat-containing protein [Cryobacterium sp. TMT2-4]|uniref:pentapeptide repeat-containing protein n=1 Tax=Cryobacterium sp. TMT2-4 TaxID=1259254 RepID=UPI00106BE6D4|nr:hypothetical protein [Cryobacterium sp. TMT2-4]TFC63858.1 hypothetical protein E3O54_16120 [Cryobacterium sp. TMT2-4]